jgi:membrane-bound lytic murein transglycosylase D
MKKQFLLAFTALLFFSKTTIAQQYIDSDNGGNRNMRGQHQALNVTAPDVPTSYTLFGERVPLDLWDVRERFDRELLFNAYMQGSTIYIIKHTVRYMPMIERILKEKNIPDDMKYLCVAESALRNQKSRVGAAGFWQFMKSTAPSYGLYVDDEVDERYDPEKSTYAACKYLRQAYNKFGNWTAAAASYNCGMGGYNGNANRQGSKNFYDLFLPEETMRYIFRIMALKYILENQKALGYNLTSEDLYQPLNTRTQTITSGLGDIAQWARAKGTNYKTVKFLNPWMRNHSLYNKKGRTYQVVLPR